jgi:hypothetical protein
LKDSPPGKFLNFEIAESSKLSFWKVKQNQKNQRPRTSDQEIEIENRLLDENENNEELFFRGPLDGITHYLVWLLVFIMPIFIPYVRRVYGGHEAPSLLTSSLVYLVFIPLIAYFLYYVSVMATKKSFWESVAVRGLSVVVVFFLYEVLCRLGLLPRLAYSTSIYLSGNTPLEESVLPWFSTFSHSKFLITYLSTILCVIAFAFQQYFNRDRIVLRLPLRKIIFFFFLTHLLSAIYPLTHPGESSFFEVSLRLHQWLQYFLIFMVLVNSMTSLGRILSITKAASISGAIVAAIGLLQYFASQRDGGMDRADRMVDVFYSYINMKEGMTPFSTFGHNNFAAAYVCLSIPITIALVLALAAKLFKESNKRGLTDFLPVVFWSLAAVSQFVYLTVSMGKAGIVSMLGALAVTSIVGLFVLEANFKKLLIKTFVIGGLAVGLGFGLLFVGLSHSEKYAHQVDETLDKWEDKFSKVFDTREGSNRVRIFYVGAAVRIMKQNTHSLITGVGANNYRFHYPLFRHPEEMKIEKAKHVNQSHCDYAQFASDTGLMGLFVFVLLMTYPLVVGLRILKAEQNLMRRFIGLGFYCTLVAMSINSLFFFPFQTPGSLLPYFVSLGLLFSLQRKNLDDSADNRVTVLLSSILILGLLFYEAWFSSEYYGADSSVWLNNGLLLFTGWAVVFVIRRLIQRAFKSPVFIFSFPAEVWSLRICLVGYVIFAYFTALSFIGSDHVNFVELNDLRRDMIRHRNDINKHVKNKRELVAYVESKVHLTMAELHETFNKTIALNGHNPEVYNNYVVCLSLYFDMVGRAFEHDFFFLENYGLRRPDQNNHIFKYLEGDLLRIWPNNKDFYERLTRTYYDWSQIVPKTNPGREAILFKTFDYAGKFLDLNPGDDRTHEQGYRGIILNIYLKMAIELKREAMVETFFTSKIENNWSVDHDICMILAQHFKSLKNTEMELRARIHSFKVFPRNSSNKDFVELGRQQQTRKYQSLEDFQSLHDLLVSYERNGLKIYPGGLVDLLREQRRKKKVIEYMTEDMKGFSSDDFRALTRILIKNGASAELEKIQLYQLQRYIYMRDLHAEKATLKKLNPVKDFDELLIESLFLGQYHISIHTVFSNMASLDYVFDLLIKEPSPRNKKAVQKLLNIEVKRNIDRRSFSDQFRRMYLRRVQVLKAIQNIKDPVANRERLQSLREEDKELAGQLGYLHQLFVKELVKLKRYYDFLEKEEDFFHYLNSIMDAGRMLTPNNNIERIRGVLKELSAKP